MPDGGSGRSYVDERFEGVWMGFRRVVIAWTLKATCQYGFGYVGGCCCQLPVKGTGEDEVVVAAEFVQTVLDEVSLVDQSTSFVDYDQCEDNPVCLDISW